jgi:hypothetical protein
LVDEGEEVVFNFERKREGKERGKVKGEEGS